MSVKTCVHHAGVEATHRDPWVCDACAARIAARLDRERARALPTPLSAGRLFGNEPT